MTKRMPMKTGDEYDGLTKWKGLLKWRTGERKRIKKAYNKKERKWLDKELKEGD
jgi:hypothetical protein